jgi:hypothetical protein
MAFWAAIPAIASIASGLLGSHKGNESIDQGTENITNAGIDVYNRGAMTGAEQSQYGSSFDLGKLVEMLAKYQSGIGQAPEGYQNPEQQFQGQGDLAKLYYQDTLSQAQNPDQYWNDTLQQQLAVANQYIDQQAQGRGLLNSGIPIESMGRAGVELAIKNAQARLANRQQVMSNAGNLSQYMQGNQQTGFSNLASLYGNQQQAGLQGMNRQAGQAQAAGQYAAYPYQAMLGSGYGQGGGTSQLGNALGSIGGMDLASMFKKG